MRVSRRTAVILLVVVFVVAFFLRAYHPVSRPLHWFTWTKIFNRAIDERNWAGTNQSSIPGFTGMVISGLTLRLYNALRGTAAEPLMSWAFPPYATGSGKRIMAGIFGLALAISGLIVAITLLLRKLADWPVALAAAGLLTFSPFFLAQSRAYNQDGLLGALMVTSALLALVGMESGKRRYLALSGLAAGLAILSKVSGVFMVPYAGLVLLVYLVAGIRAEWPAHRQGRAGWLAKETWRGLVGPYLLWLLGLGVAFALWPAMWVEPGVVIGEILERVGGHLGEGHGGRFFAGQVYDNTRPPLLFYPVTFAFNTSFVTLTLVFVALGQYTVWRKRVRLPLSPVIFWLLVAYVVFFTVQMTIGADQDDRYIFPAFLMLEVLAATGLVGVIGLAQQAVKSREGNWVRALPVSVLALAVGMQALIALPFAPNYGAHHNQLLGGNRVAIKVVEVIGQNEGLNYVADYLSQQPEVNSLQIGAKKSINKTLRQYFGGEVNQNWSNKDDYNLISVRDLQREPDYWAEKQAVYEGATPQVLVIIDGVPFMWLYARNPPTPFEPVVIRRGGGIGFIVLAWVWTVALVAALVWALRHAAKLDEGQARD